MGCRTACFPREILQKFCLEETEQYRLGPSEGSLETQETWASYNKVGWKAMRKGLAQMARPSIFFPLNFIIIY